MKILKSDKPIVSKRKGSLELWINKWNLKVMIWGIKRQTKRVLKIQLNAYRLLNLSLKNILLQKYQDKKAPYISKLSLVISSHHADLKIPDDYLDFAQKEKEVIDNEIRSVFENDNLKQIISDYYLLLSFINYIIPSDETKKLSDQNLEKAISYNKDAMPLTNESLRTKKIEIKNRLKEEKRKYNKLIRDKKYSYIRSILPNIKLSYQLIGFIFTFISA